MFNLLHKHAALKEKKECPWVPKIGKHKTKEYHRNYPDHRIVLNLHHKHTFTFGTKYFRGKKLVF